jgi:hypothetical protein
LSKWRKSGSAELRDILPSRASATLAFVELIKYGKYLRRFPIVDDHVPSFDEPLSNDEIRRMRYAKAWRVMPKWKRFGPRFGRAFSLAWYGLNGEERVYINDLFRTIGIFQVSTAPSLVSLLKKVTQVYKKYGDLLTKGTPLEEGAGWMKLVNWETGGGYLNQKPIEAFFESIKDWVTGDVKHYSWNNKEGQTEDQFYTDFRAGVKDFFNDLPGLATANERAETIKEWSGDISQWARSGATKRREGVRYYVDGKMKNAKGSKWRTALALRPSTIEAVLSGHRHIEQRNSAVQKVETGKVRAVVNSDDETYWMMAYVSHWLERALKGTTKSTLFMNVKQLAEMWESMAKDTEIPWAVKIPLDQDEFDHQVNVKMLSIMVEEIGRLVRRLAPARVRGDLLHVCNKIHRTLTRGGTVRVGKEKIQITKGIMSGWRWTALLDTISNWAETYTAALIIQRLGGSYPYLNVIAQGDDDRVNTRGWMDAAMVYLAYNVMRFKVNPSKFFVDNIRDEYLRRVARPGMVTGYYFRSITSVLWRNPISRDPVAGIERLGEIAKSWNIFISRGMPFLKGYKQYLNDAVGGSKIPRGVIEEITYTPACMGGLGYGSWGRMEYSPGFYKKEYVIERKDVRGLSELNTRWEKIAPFYDSERFLDSMVENLDLPSSKKDVVPGSYRKSTVTGSFAAHLTVGYVPLTAPASDSLPLTGRDEVLKQAIRQRAWPWIRNVYVDEHMRAVSRRIEQNGGRRVWIDWLTGNLPIKPPNIWGYSSAYVSAYFDAVSKAGMSLLVSLHKFTYKTVVRVGVLVEDTTRERVKQTGIRVAD